MSAGTNKSESETAGTSISQDQYDPDWRYMQQLYADEMYGPGDRSITGSTAYKRGILPPDSSIGGEHPNPNWDPVTRQPYVPPPGHGGNNPGPDPDPNEIPTNRDRGGHNQPGGGQFGLSARRPAAVTTQGATTSNGPIQGDPLQGRLDPSRGQGALTGFDNGSWGGGQQDQENAMLNRTGIYSLFDESGASRYSLGQPINQPTRGTSGRTPATVTPATTTPPVNPNMPGYQLEYDPNFQTQGATTNGVGDSGTAVPGSQGTLPPGGGIQTMPTDYVPPPGGVTTEGNPNQTPGSATPPPVNGTPSPGSPTPGDSGNTGGTAPPPVPYSLTEPGPITGVDAQGNPTRAPGVTTWNTGGASGNRQLAGGRLFDSYNNDILHPELDAQTKNALEQEGMNSARSQYAGMRGLIDRQAAATHNSAGSLAAKTRLGQAEAGTLGQQGRQNVLDEYKLEQEKKNRGLTGMQGLYAGETGYQSSLLTGRGGLSNKPVKKYNDTHGTGNIVGGNFGVSLG